MKTKFYFLPILLLGGLSLFTACSDDDDENGGGQPSGPVIGPSGTNSGARLTSISAGWGKTTYFQYNEDGTIKRISEEEDGEEDDWIAMTYNPFRIETKDNGFLKNVSFNDDGYLTGLAFEYSESDEEEGWSETGKGDMKLTYNSNGNLTKITVTGSYSGKGDGESFSGEYTGSITYSWIEGNLAKIQSTYDFGDGELSTETYEFEYSDEVNKFQQYIIGVDDATGFSEDFAPIGWLGKWSKNYPSSCTELKVEEDDEGKETYTGTHSWSNFSTTSDGLLSGFNYNGNRYTYTYDNTAPTAKKAAAKQTLNNNAPSPRTKKMSRRHLRHARMLNRK